MFASGSIAAMALIACTSGAASVRAQGSLATPGCWRFDRPLGSSATGNVEGTDTTWRVIGFRGGGGLTFPLMTSAHRREMWERASGWRAEGDSLRAMVFTGLAGWRLVLREQRPNHDTRTGTAHYLSDVIVNGRAYTTSYPVSAVRVPCPAGFDAAANAPAGWNPDRTVAYFETQVDTRAALLRDSPRPTLPRGMSLSGPIRSILAQFVVDQRGRIDSATLRFPRVRREGVEPLGNDLVTLQLVVQGSLSRMRYRPATMKGRPVAQLVYETFSFD